MEHSDTNSNWCCRCSHRRSVTGTVGLRNKRTCGDHRHNNIIEISQNTEKSPGDLTDLLSIKLQWKTIS